MNHPIATDLIDAARTGNPTQIEHLLEFVWPHAYRLAFSILGHRAGAEDAAQEACITLYRSISSLREASAFRVWLYRIVMRAAMDVKRRNLTPDAVDEAGVYIDGVTSVDVWRALATLPPNLRSVVVLRYFEDLSSREIANVLRVPDGTVRFRLAMARRRLRPLLEIIETPQSKEVRIHAV